MDDLRTPPRPIADYLALGPRAVLLDEVLSVDDDGIVVAAHVDAGAVYFRDGVVPGVALIEYLAQTVGAFVGYHEVTAGRRAPTGLLVACPSARFPAAGVAEGTSLRLEAARFWGRREVGAFRCRAWACGEQLAEATLSVFRPEESMVESWKSQL